MSKIPVKYHSHYDSWKHKVWPTELLCRPMVGDYVEASDGTLGKITLVIHGWRDVLTLELQTMSRQIPKG